MTWFVHVSSSIRCRIAAVTFGLLVMAMPLCSDALTTKSTSPKCVPCNEEVEQKPLDSRENTAVLDSTRDDLTDSKPDRQQRVIRRPKRYLTSRRPFTTPTTASPEAFKQKCTKLQPPCTEEEVLVEATNFLHNLSTPHVTVSSNQLPEIVSQVNKILKMGGNISSRASEVLLDIDVILTKMGLENNRDVVQEVQSEVAVMVVNIEKVNPVVGLTFSTSEGNLTPNSLKHIRLNETTRTIPQQTEVAVILPQSLLARNTRMLFIVFAGDKAFKSNTLLRSTQGEIVNSRVLNINLSNGKSIIKELAKGQYIDIMFKPYLNNNLEKKCAFWDFQNNNWSSTGGELVKSSITELDVCRYYHLTNFAQIITKRTTNTRALDVISLIGCTLSLIGIIGIFVTAIAFENWRNHLGNKILLHLSSSIAFNIITFLVIATSKIDTESVGCIVIGAIMHFSILAAFCWMLVSAGLQFLRLVVVLGSRRIPHLLLKASVFAWGIPLIPVFVLLAIDPHIYTAGDDRSFCYPEGTAYYLAVMAPVILIVLINTVVFVSILFQIYPCCHNRLSVQRHSTDKKVVFRRLMTTVLLFFLFGLTWIFGLFARLTVFAYLFCVTATMQGFVLFIFFVVVETKARSYWVNSTSRVTSSERVTSKTNSLPESVALNNRETYRTTGSENTGE